MPRTSQPIRLLVKTTKLPDQGRLKLDGRTLAATAEPLFSAIGTSTMDAAPQPYWQVLTADLPQDVELTPWDLCHGLIEGRFGLAGDGGILFAEPDLEQRWTFPDPDESTRECVPPPRPGKGRPQDCRFPTDPDPVWTLARTKMVQARAGLPQPGQPVVRIAHLDTGYDPDHVTKPVKLRLDLQRNVSGDGHPEDKATDPRRHGLTPNKPGHGTGTLGLLAGGAVPDLGTIGAIPFAEIVPIRVADSVVLFRNSAIARALDYVFSLSLKDDPATRIDVVTMSMGGVPSQAWADAINALYDIGVFVVTAAGNNLGNLPTRQIVWPARFRRVVAACGVMADKRPYADLPRQLMAGNYGPDSKMETAIAAPTPNTPWAQIGGKTIVDLDGAGTSSATPLVAAAAALVIQARRAEFDKTYTGWRRVEAVRAVLFATAGQKKDGRSRLGQGTLDAAEAVKAPLPALATLTEQKKDTVSFPILRLLLPFGLTAAPSATLEMLELEALQLTLSFPLEALIEDVDQADSLTPAQIRRLAEELATQPTVSARLRRALQAHVPVPPGTGNSGPGGGRGRAVRSGGSGGDDSPPPGSDMARLHLAHAIKPDCPPPARRRLQVFAYDPLLSTQIENQDINRAILDIPWEKELHPGPVGEYLEVVDIDPPSRSCYAPVDLNHPNLLSRDGLAPSESNPQFHQQMVYAVAMKTIDRFEIALGRPVQWSSYLPDGKHPGKFVRRLRVHPHAFCDRNAYYSPDRKALLFGYFRANSDSVGDTMPGGLVFSCLSHDIVAHETTHAILDGLHPRFREASNPDVLAFHEAFADIVALFQHFSLPEALRHQLAEVGGDIGKRCLLAELARQFGEATGHHGALRSAIQSEPKPTDYASATEAHDRGAVLVAALFAAFLRIYRRRADELMRLASGGTGVMPAGALPEILVDELARTAAKVADQVLTICIRALDYCPPIDITFGDYLRALITADRDVVPDDTRLYRIAFIASFRERGIYPAGVPSLSADSLLWEPPPPNLLPNLASILPKLEARWLPDADREASWTASNANAADFDTWLMNQKSVSDEEFAALGLIRVSGRRQPWTLNGMNGELGGIEIHSVRPTRRVTQDRTVFRDVVVEITQTWRHASSSLEVRGGCTLLIDRRTGQVRYLIRKRLDQPQRIEQQLRMTAASEARSYFGTCRGSEPFAILHCAH
jgi:subtilisin family serine protease